jgi:hypothetical protein
MYLSESQVQDYERDGAIVIKGVFKDWIDCLVTGFDKVLKVTGGDFLKITVTGSVLKSLSVGLLSRLPQKLRPKPHVQNASKYFMSISY